jgi:hypothetical protein
MKRGVFDVLRRSLDNTLANWPLIGIRVGEMLVMIVATIATAIAILAPFLVSVGIELTEIATPADFQRMAVSLVEKWIYLVWAVVAILILTIVFVAVHAFVEAGCARVYVDAERIAGPEVVGPRSRFKVFSMQRWFAGGRDGWWSVFWIYNFAWSVAGLILLIPLLPTAAVMFFTRETPPVAATAGCLGLLLTLMLTFLVAIVTGIWTNRAIAEWGGQRTGAATSLSLAWQAVKLDLGRHVLIALAIFVVALAGSSFFASFSFLATFSESLGRGGSLQIALLPVRFLTSMLSWIFSAAISSWYLAAYASLVVEGRR